MEVEALQNRKAVSELHKDRRTPKPALTQSPALSKNQAMGKRLLDYVILCCSAPLVLPIALVTALLIKLDSKGPVLFTQERVGEEGNIFTMYKFRSMKVDAEKNGSKFASENDSRVTKLGNFIRTYRIDELPQFWNVLKGDMSVIGPRPEQAKFVEFFNGEIEQYNLRHRVKPGITGLAQVYQGYAACKRTTKFKLDYDLFYIRNYSIGMDLLIVFKTIQTILTGFGSR